MSGEIYSGESIEVPDGNMAAWFETRVDEHGDDPAALVREGDAFTEITYREFYEDARAVGAGLLEQGLDPGDRVAIRSETRYEWSVVDLGCVLAGLILVPVYPSFTPFEAEAPSSRSDRTGASRAGRKPTPPRPTHSS